MPQSTFPSYIKILLDFDTHNCEMPSHVYEFTKICWDEGRGPCFKLKEEMSALEVYSINFDQTRF